MVPGFFLNHLCEGTDLSQTLSTIQLPAQSTQSRKNLTAREVFLLPPPLESLPRQLVSQAKTHRTSCSVRFYIGLVGLVMLNIESRTDIFVDFLRSSLFCPDEQVAEGFNASQRLRCLVRRGTGQTTRED